MTAPEFDACGEAPCPYFRPGNAGTAPQGSCASRGSVVGVGRQHEAALCRSVRHVLCSRYEPLPVAREQPAASLASTPPASARGSVRPLLTTAAMAILVVGATVAAFRAGNPFGAEPEAGTAATAAATTASPAAAAATPLSTPQAAPLTTPAPAQPATPTATSTPRRYTVQPGDSLTALARRFGVSERALAAANGLAPTAKLLSGQVLQVPAAASPTPAEP